MSLNGPGTPGQGDNIMRQILTIACASVVAVLFAAPAHAGEGEGRRGHRKHRIFKHLDKNQDGALAQDEVPARLWERISQADADGSGSVTKEEAKAFREKRRAAGAAEGTTVGVGERRGTMRRLGMRRGRMLKHLDKNQDKALSQDEVSEKLWEKISKADADHDGAVTKEEAQAYRKARRDARAGSENDGQTVGAGKARGKNRGRRGHRVRRAWNRLDKNQDGKLSQEEVPEKLWERIRGADTDGDGAVSKEELKARRDAKRKETRGK